MYQDDAVDLIDEQIWDEPADAEPSVPPRSFAAPPVKPEARGPLPYPEPVGINDNLQRYAQLKPISERPRISVGRIVGWVLVGPWYVAVAATSIGIDVLFAKAILGL